MTLQILFPLKMLKAKLVDCVEVKTEDTLYLVKVSKRLIAAMEDFDADEYNDDDDDGDDDDEPDFDLGDELEEKE